MKSATLIGSMIFVIALTGCAEQAQNKPECAKRALALQNYVGQDVQSLMLANEQISTHAGALPIEITNDRAMLSRQASNVMIVEIEDPKAYTNTGFAHAQVRAISCADAFAKAKF